MPDFDRIRVLLHSDGLLHWEPGGIFRTTCDINIAYFPFDSQRCPLLIGAYSYHSTRMNITNASRAISTHDFRVNGEWHIITTSAEWGVTILSPPGGFSQLPSPDNDAADRWVSESSNTYVFVSFPTSFVHLIPLQAHDLLQLTVSLVYSAERLKINENKKDRKSDEMTAFTDSGLLNSFSVL